MDPVQSTQFSQNTVSVELPVQWGDQDLLGHVNNVVYFRWFESARFAYVEQTDLMEWMLKANLGVILASVKCDYKIQLKYPDTVRVTAKVERIGRSSVLMTHEVHSKALGTVAATGESVVVAFDYLKQASSPVPDEVRAKLSAFEGRQL